MTKETKVGLVIGLVFMFGVVYVLSWFGPSEFEQQVADYRARKETASERKDAAMGTENIPLSAVDTIDLSKETVQTAVDPAPPKKVDKFVPSAFVKESPVVKTIVIPAKPKPRFYVVKEGQTLSDVAGEVYGWANRHEFRRIHKANEYKVPNVNMIWPGLKLRIPPLKETKPTKITKVLSLGGARTYTVMPGDTLSEISSEKLGTATRAGEIFKLNRDKLTNMDSIKVGMVLKLP